MVNVNVQGPVVLEGKGLTWRTSSQYEPGELQIASNVRLTDRGTYKNRPPVQGFSYETVDPLGYSHGMIVGSFGADCLVSYPNRAPSIAKVSSLKYLTTGWATFRTNVLAQRPTVATDGGHSNSIVTIVGYFTYGDREYAITQCSYRPLATTNLVTYVLVMSAPRVSFLEPNTWDMHVALGNVVNILTDTGMFASTVDVWYAANPRICQPLVQDWVVFRDRLWLAIGDAVYASYPTDPTDFITPGVPTDPGGFFFRIPNQIVKSFSGLGDRLYLTCDSSIHVLSYTSNPNVDSELQIISNAVGGEDSTVLGDTVYVAKPNAIYAVNGNNVSKVYDLEVQLYDTSTKRLVFDVGTGHFSQGGTFAIKMEAYENCLYFTRRYFTPVSGAIGAYDVIPTAAPIYAFGASPFGTSNLLRLDMDNGFLSEYSFGQCGTPVDCLFVPIEDRNNQTRFFMIGAPGIYAAASTRVFCFGNRFTPFSSAADPNNPVYIFTVGANEGALDTVVDPVNQQALVNQIPSFSIMISNFSPDNLRYLIKKFRSIEVELRVPSYMDASVKTPMMGLKLYSGDTNDASTTTSEDNVTSNYLLETLLSPRSLDTNSPINDEIHRYGLNQRCKRISLLFSFAGDVYTGLNATSRAHSLPNWEIRDIRTLWSYTSRGPTNDKFGS